MGLGRAIMDELDSWNGLLDDPEIRKLHIKMSGCPNGCGLHHIANIGFHGAAMKGPNGVQVPAYEVFLGGSYGIGRPEDTRIGERLPRIKVPAKRVPQLVRSLAVYYKENRLDSEEFNDFLDRVGPEPVAALAQEYCEIAPLGPDSLDLYMDWSHTSVYKLERGEGECSA
jgi:sulfite reductase beta subunit-like hemoprotein